MNLLDEILLIHSKKQMLKIVKWIGQSQTRFDELVKHFMTGKDPVPQRASYPLSEIVRIHPQLVGKHLGKLLKNLQKDGHHNAVRRGTVRILQDIDIPKRYHGQVMNLCFNYIQSHTEHVAVKAFSLTVLQKMLPLYPDIKNELVLIINERWPHESAAFHSRARKILKAYS